jgi:uncharacterized damage-inducible protein DinB
MHPRIREVMDYLGDRRIELRRAVGDVPVALRNRRPAPERWSVVEVLEHVALVEERIVQLFTAQLADARAKGLGPERDSSPVLPTFNTSQLADRTRRLVATEAAQPRGAVDVGWAWERLERAREATHDALRSADGLALAEVVAPNPVLGALNLYQWILFIGGHEARHTGQIREIGAALAQA